MGDGTFLGLSRDQQNAIILVVGAALVVAGLAGSSSVDPSYDPLPFGVGLVMVGYAVVAFAYDRVRGVVAEE